MTTASRPWFRGDTGDRAGAPEATFVDYAPVHVITSATLDEIGAVHIRYRPNLIIETSPGTAPFIENGWVGHEHHVAGGGGTTRRHTR
ncbi:MAG: hypothetical protein ACRDRW_20085 [Pseudonocardiaceae bacterium]